MCAGPIFFWAAQVKKAYLPEVDLNFFFWAGTVSTHQRCTAVALYPGSAKSLKCQGRQAEDASGGCGGPGEGRAMERFKVLLVWAAGQFAAMCPKGLLQVEQWLDRRPRGKEIRNNGTGDQRFIWKHTVTDDCPGRKSKNEGRSSEEG